MGSLILALIIGEIYLFITKSPDELSENENESCLFLYLGIHFFTMIVIFIYAFYKAIKTRRCCYLR